MKPQVKRRLPDLLALLDALKRDRVDAVVVRAILRVAGYDSDVSESTPESGEVAEFTTGQCGSQEDE